MSSDWSEMSPEELWGHCTEKYRNNNPVAKWLLDGFFTAISQVVDSFDESDRLLELGCGPGESSLRIMKMLRGQHFEVSEYEERLVGLLRQMHFPLTISQESVYALRRKDNEFDGVFLLEVLEHLEDYRGALKEIFRVSRKHVVISVPNEPLWRMLNLLRGKYVSKFGNTPGHINHWNQRSLLQLVGEFGVCQQILTPIPWIVVHAKVR